MKSNLSVQFHGRQIKNGRCKGLEKQSATGSYVRRRVLRTCVCSEKSPKADTVNLFSEPIGQLEGCDSAHGVSRITKYGVIRDTSCTKYVPLIGQMTKSGHHYCRRNLLIAEAIRATSDQNCLSCTRTDVQDSMGGGGRC